MASIRQPEANDDVVPHDYDELPDQGRARGSRGSARGRPRAEADWSARPSRGTRWFPRNPTWSSTLATAMTGTWYAEYLSGLRR
jgi:hypothetical protein